MVELRPAKPTVIDDTGDRKKGQHTDYVKQYINRQRLRMALLPAYGLINNTVPLLFEVYKPKERLKPEDSYRSKPEIAAGMMQESNGISVQLSIG